MMQIELPHLNIFTKWDLVEDKQALEKLLDSQPSDLVDGFNKKYAKLSSTIAGLLEDFSLIRFVTLDITNEDSIDNVMAEIDMLVQYKEYTLPDDNIYNAQDQQE